MMRVAAFALLLAAPALADCPSPMALERPGITVTFDDGSRSTFRAVADGIEETTVVPEAGGDFSYGGVYGAGLIPLREYDLDAGLTPIPDSVYVSRYDRDLSGFYDLNEGQSLRAAFVDQGRQETLRGTLTVTRGARKGIELGDCNAISVEFVFDKRFDDGSRYRMEFDYLQDYGITLFTASTYEGGDRVEYRPVSIR